MLRRGNGFDSGARAQCQTQRLPLWYSAAEYESRGVSLINYLHHFFLLSCLSTRGWNLPWHWWWMASWKHLSTLQQSPSQLCKIVCFFSTEEPWNYSHPITAAILCYTSLRGVVLLKVSIPQTAFVAVLSINLHIYFNSETSFTGVHNGVFLNSAKNTLSIFKKSKVD